MRPTSPPALLLLALAGIASPALAGVSATTPAPAAETPATPALPKLGPPAPPPVLSPFQWALQDAGQLVLVPEGDRWYPAALSGRGVIETLPLKVEVRLHDGREMVVPLTEVLAPWEVTGPGWVLERRTPEGWAPATASIFHDGIFYHLAEPGRFDGLKPGEIRFRRR